MPRKKEPTFEEQLAQLEEIVQTLDGEDLPLEQAISSYEQGVKLSVKLNKTLEEAQRKIEILTESAGSELDTRPFEESPGDEA